MNNVILQVLQSATFIILESVSFMLDVVSLPMKTVHSSVMG